MGKEIKFRPATFYMGIADMLAREVEGQSMEDDDHARRVSQVPSGVDLEELPGDGEPAPRTNEKDSPESKAEKGRAQMVDSLDAVGASVHDLNTSIRTQDSPSHTPSPSPPPLKSGPRTFSKRDPPS